MNRPERVSRNSMLNLAVELAPVSRVNTMADPAASGFNLATTQPMKLHVSATSIISKMMATQGLLQATSLELKSLVGE